MSNIAKTLQKELDKIKSLPGKEETESVIVTALSEIFTPGEIITPDKMNTVVAVSEEVKIHHLPPVDWECAYCTTPQPGERVNCSQCGAPRPPCNDLPHAIFEIPEGGFTRR